MTITSLLSGKSSVAFMLTAMMLQMVSVTEGASVFNKRWWNPNTKYAPIFHETKYIDISTLVGVSNIPGYIAALGDFNSDRL